jgi:tetratricopeptide (TPR) repeat protein
VKFIHFIAGLLASVIFLSSCQTPPQTRALLLDPPQIAKQHAINNVPFYPQQDFYCGPTTLAEVANFNGLSITPNEIAPLTFVPGLEGSLQVEMLAATRKLGMVAYSQQGTMALLLGLLADNIPVIVLQNNSIALLPKWHYAVLTGYDLDKQEVIMHSGVTQDHHLNFSTFERTWQRGNFWMLAMLPANKMTATLEPFNYLKACQDLLDTGHESVALEALQSAIAQWPDYWLGYFLLGNHYLASSPEIAANWYTKGYSTAKNEAVYLNNYAYALGELHCYAEAQTIILEGLALAPNDNNLLDTQQQLLKASKNNSDKPCAMPQPLDD